MKLVGWLVHRVWLVHRCSRCSNVSTLKFHVETEDTKPEINLYCYYYKENYSYNDAKQKVIRVFVYTCTCANKKQYCHNETQDSCNDSAYQVDQYSNLIVFDSPEEKTRSRTNIYNSCNYCNPIEKPKIS